MFATMSEPTEIAGGESTVIESGSELAIPITVRVLGVGMLGGLLGMVTMIPVLVGVPAALGLFRPDPIAEFVPLTELFGIEPTLALGLALFAAMGTVLLPMVFLVVGAYLPPEGPRYLRGVTFATIFWTGFVPAFMPEGPALVAGTFLVVSLVAHWVYGAVLAGVLDRTVGIPQHEV
ncbi:cytochrome C oxidase subunit I [Halobaculum magnesiiphilum]|uniref:Cytochrome C oxidase subunit I n=2 Tax=Halobaculum magnesiiphilum TaxID=1017351 RepID=A0A8T8WGK6_9EURY|nr:cytochrome C oxidase subunit I [Halobaculum magnesiiphilum]